MLESSDVLSHWLPLVLGGIAVALAALCLGQFFSFKKLVVRALAGARDIEPLEAKVVQMSVEMDELRERLGERDADRPAPAGWPQEVAGVNLNRRGQVLRLRRRGRTVEEIASTLEIPRGEVELMVKVHELSQKAAGAASAGGASSFPVDTR
jgi:DNA-binding NarL/FixJ family response regulator